MINGTDQKVIYEIINPSDKYTIAATRFEVAVVAALILGNGAYGLQEVGGDEHMPLMLFGPQTEWFKSRFGQSLEEVVDSVSKLELADCLASIVVGDREAYDVALPFIPAERHDEFWSEWHERGHGSLNDIGSKAQKIAKKLSEQQQGS